MGSRKCPRCGLVNWTQDVVACKRCGAAFDATPTTLPGAASERAAPLFEEEDEPRGGGLLKRALIILGIVSLFIVGAYVSLIVTSDPVTIEQRQTVARAIDLLEAKGFGERAFLLRRVARFRTSDNWWNRWNGHHQAYAATNFPFEIVTLYPDFFKQPTDDTERAVVLLHESYHLAGGGEEKAFTGTWRDKQRLGWTRERYGQTRVWQNVREFTAQNAPELFRCGEDGKGDCLDVK